MNTQEHLENGGRIVRQRKGRRVITIAYRENDDGTIDYGATIFQKQTPNEQWTKDGQRQIAIDRLTKNPVTVPSPGLRPAETDQYVRKCLVDHGCYDSEITEVSG
jgi:hypothetical protein